MNKTPVSILQEMMVKKGTVPNYELIHDGGGTHINTFVYRVMCDGFIAEGTGRCKKDAKHTAAKNMLETIANARRLPELPATPVDSPVRTPRSEPLPSSPRNSSNEPFLNAIGELKDLCIGNELQDPEYNMISDVGPPHARVFTYQCIVSSFREEARATTKKQAKHEASKKMLDRLIEVVKDLKDNDGMYSGLKKERPSVSTENENALSRYAELTKSSTKKVNLGVKMSDYHTKLKNTYTEESVPTRDQVENALVKLKEMLRENEETSLDNDTKLELLNECFIECLEPMNLAVSSMVLKGNNDSEKVAFVKLNTTPDITEVEIGDDETLIQMKCMEKVLNALQELMN